MQSRMQTFSICALLMKAWEVGFSRLRVTLQHFDFDVGSTFGMVAFGV